VKLARAAEVAGVEIVATGSLEVPEADRGEALERFGDAVRIAAKLRLPVAIAGSIEAVRLPSLLLAAPAVERVVVGRSLLARALLVGMERAVRELRDAIR
jgi:pyridoxine 5-phosphate synthase